MLLPEKKNKYSFDFHKTTIPKKQKPYQRKIFKVLWSFIFLQYIFGGYNLYRVQDHLYNAVEQNNSMFENYNNMKLAMTSGEQNKTVALFAKVKNSNSPIGDLLLGGTLISLHMPQEPTMPKEYTTKVTPETLKILDSVYRQDYNSGVVAERKNLQNISCFYVDLTCYIGRHIIQKTSNENLNNFNKKIIKNYYDFEHFNEYMAWQKTYMSYIEKGLTVPDNLTASPGKKYVDKL